MDGARDLGLLAGGDIGADRLGFALDRLGRQIHAGKRIEQRAASLEGGLGADHCGHAAHSGRVLRGLDVELAVARDKAASAATAMIIRPFDDDRPQHGDELLGTRAGAARLSAAVARQVRLARLGLVQQPLEHPRAGSVQGVARGLLERFEIERAGLATLGKDRPQQPPYFRGDLLLDRFGRFFSWGVSLASSSTGRKEQSCSLTSSSCWHSCRKRW